MTCDVARELLVAEQEDLTSAAERATLRAHLATCAACRAEEVTLHDTYTALRDGLHALVAPVTPSADFWARLNADLDTIDAEHSAAATVPGRPRPIRTALPWSVRVAATLALLAALLAGLFASGEAQHAWAALRQWLSFVPALDLGQVEPTALVLPAPVSAGNGAATLTVTGLVGGQRGTLLAYTLRGAALAVPSNVAPVADAVDVVLSGAHARRYVPTYWLPVQQGTEQGMPAIRGMLAFPALARGERSLRLVATRLPLAAPAARPWILTLPLQPARRGGAQTSFPVERSATHAGIRLTVTDVTFTGGATVVDMDIAVTGGPHVGTRVVSLAPEQAVGDFAPVLYAGSRAVGARVAPLPAPVRLAILPRPEFVFPATLGAAGTVVVPAVAVQEPQSATVSVTPGARVAIPVRLGAATLSIARSEVVTPVAALGLDGGQVLRLTLAFPPQPGGATLQSVGVVVDGVVRTVSRDDPRVEIPLVPGRRRVAVTLQDAQVMVRGPWRVAIGGE